MGITTGHENRAAAVSFNSGFVLFITPFFLSLLTYTIMQLRGYADS